MIDSSVLQGAHANTLDPDFVRRFRHEGEDCLRCNGLGFRSQARCAGCGARAGIEVKSLTHERSVKSGKETRTLPFYCMECNPRFFLRGIRSEAQRRTLASNLLLTMVAANILPEAADQVDRCEEREKVKGDEKKAGQG